MNLISSNILQYCGFLRFHSTLCRFIPQCFDFLNLTFIFILKMCDHFLTSFLKHRLTKAISRQGPSCFILVVHIKFINVNGQLLYVMWISLLQYKSLQVRQKQHFSYFLSNWKTVVITKRPLREKCPYS